MIDAAALRRMASDPAEFRRGLLIDTDDGPRPFKPDDWQREDFEALDAGWQQCIGLPVQNGKSRGYLERPRGHAKTSDQAIMATWAIGFAARQISGIAAAGDRDQARLLRDAIARLVSLNPWLVPAIDVQNYRVINLRTGSTLEILSSDAPTSYGLTPDFISIDEITNWQNRDLWDSLISAAAKRRNCMVVVISNAGLGMGTSWQWSIRESCRQSADWYFSRIDGPQASWIIAYRLDEQRQMLPRKVFARLWLNLWQAEIGDALEAEDIAAAVVPGLMPMRGDESGFIFVGGIDLGTRRDRSAVIVIGANTETRRLQLGYCQSWAAPPAGTVDLEAVRDAVIDVHFRFRLSRCLFDPYQAMLLAQQASRAGVPMMEFPFSGANCHKMASAILEVFRSRRIDLFDESQLLRDLSRLRIVEKSFGWKLEAPHDGEGHADSAFALAIALPAAVELAGWGSFVPRVDRSPVVDLCEALGRVPFQGTESNESPHGESPEDYRRRFASDPAAARNEDMRGILIEAEARE